MRKLILFFLVVTSLTSILFVALDRHSARRRDRVMQNQALVIQNEVQERLRLYLDRTNSARILAAFWEQGEVSDREYDNLAAKVTGEYPEVLGLNQLDVTGNITRVYPLKDNQGALGRVSQNIEPLRASLAQGEPSWFSHPFDLYQGGRGFIGYSPLFRGKTHLGWLAIVISTERFFENFTQNEFGRNFHLEVLDLATGASYFRAPGDLPAKLGRPFHETVREEFGRKIVIRIWPRAWVTPGPPSLLPIGFSVVIGFIATFAFAWWHDRRRALHRLAELNHLLELTIRETGEGLRTLQGLLEAMKHDPKLISFGRLGRKVSYLSNVVEQMLLLRDIASQNRWKGGPLPLLTPVLEVAEAWSERLRAQDLFLNYDPEELSAAQVNVQRGLFTHGLLANLLDIMITQSPPGATVTLAHRIRGGGHVLALSSSGGTPTDEASWRDPGADYALQMARQVAEFHGGQVDDFGEGYERRFEVWLPNEDVV